MAIITQKKIFTLLQTYYLHVFFEVLIKVSLINSINFFLKLQINELHGL